MLIVYWVVGFAAFWLLVIAGTAAWEKRQVWPYVLAANVAPEKVPPLNAYVNEAAAAAMGMGFAPLGVYIDGKGKMYRIRYDFFRAASGDVLAIVGTGSVASIPVQTTWLHTLLSDGRSLVSIDNQTGGEIDLAGLTLEALCKNVGFAELLAFHHQRLSAVSVPLLPFPEANPLEALRHYRQGRVERLTTMGYASCLDEQRNVWRYSLKGAVKLAFRQYFTGLRREIVSDASRLPRRH